MKLLWTHRHIQASVERVWDLLVTVDQWPAWGPSVRSVSLDAPRIQLGSQGIVQTTLGFSVPFLITVFDEPRCWAWRVAGVEATHHCVEDVGGGKVRVGFGVPWPAPAYSSTWSIRFCISRVMPVSVIV